MIISLGSDCSVAYNMQKHGVRNCALPFDWIKSSTMTKVVDILRDNFQSWCDPALYEFQKMSTVHPYIQHDTFVDYCSDEQQTCVYKHKQYDVQFFHDFKSRFVNTVRQVHDDDEDKYHHQQHDFQQVMDKYQRRITRFKQALNGDENVHFIRIDRNKTSYNFEAINVFCQWMLNTYPNCKYKFTLILFDNKPVTNSTHHNLNSNCRVIYYQKTTTDTWKIEGLDWSQVFSNY